MAGSAPAEHEPNGLRVVVVDDEPTIRDVATEYLRSAGYDVVAIGDGDSALRHLRNDVPDLVVLDVMLPGTDGLSILAALRSFTEVPVILLTARSEESDRIRGLEAGADDYVVKPFSPRELVARVRSVLRRVQPKAGEPLEFGSLSIDPVAREVRRDGEVIALTRREFELLHFLASHAGTVFSRADLLAHVWGSSPDWQDPSTVTVHVRRLRRKLEPDPEEPRWITTSWGVGYRFEP